MSTLLRMGALLTIGSLLAGCTSLTQSDEIRINKDPPKSAVPDPVPTPDPTPAPAADALQRARDGAPARPAKKAGSG